MDSAVARERALDAAEELFYGRGIQSVGMDDIRSASGVSLKRLYQLFPAKEQLVEAYLERRDGDWRGGLAADVGGEGGPGRRVLAGFCWGGGGVGGGGCPGRAPGEPGGGAGGP